MKNKVFALLLFSVTVLGLSFYLLTVFEDEIIGATKEEQQQSDEKDIQPDISLVPVQDDIKVADDELQEVDGDYEKVLQIDKSTYFLQKRINKLELRDPDKNILGVFPYAKQSSLQKIYGNTQELLFSIGEKRYIVDTSGVQFRFDLVPEIIYAKKNKGQYLLKTKIGVFSYDIQKKNIEYQPLFSDFIVFDRYTYIGVVKKDEQEKQNFFGIDINTDVIFSYNTKTKEKKILIELDQSLEKIYESGKAILVETTDGEKLRLRNFVQ